MKRFADLVQDCLSEVEELLPWDLEQRLSANDGLLLLDVREPHEFQAMHIQDSLNVPRGVLESASEYDYEETEPELVKARDRDVIVICRSGNRSVLAARTLKQLGYGHVCSLKTGLKGWNDYEQPLVDGQGQEVAIETADRFLTPRLRPDQSSKKSGKA